MRKFLPYLLILLLLSGTAFFIIFRPEPTVFNTVSVSGKLRLSVPSYLTKTDSIDAEAILQYENNKEQVYLVVYEQSDTSHRSMQECFEKFSNALADKLEHGALLNYVPEKINGCDAFTGNIRGSAKETSLYYRVMMIGSAEKYYEVIFCVGDNNQSSYREDIDTLIHSVKIQP